MGPQIGPDPSMKTFELRPYRSSTTYQNLKARGEGVFHVTDDVLLLAQTAIGEPLVQRLLKIEPHEQSAPSQLADLARSHVEVPGAHRGAGQSDHRQVPA